MKVWKLLTNQHNCTVLPAKSLAVALFLMSCIQKDYLFPKIEWIRFNIKFCHKHSGYTDPCSPFVVFNILVAAKRLPVHKTRKKKPITIEHLKLLYQKLALKAKSFKVLDC